MGLRERLVTDGLPGPIQLYGTEHQAHSHNQSLASRMRKHASTSEQFSRYLESEIARSERAKMRYRQKALNYLKKVPVENRE